MILHWCVYKNYVIFVQLTATYVSIYSKDDFVANSIFFLHFKFNSLVFCEETVEMSTFLDCNILFIRKTDMFWGYQWIYYCNCKCVIPKEIVTVKYFSWFEFQCPSFRATPYLEIPPAERCSDAAIRLTVKRKLWF